MSAIVQKDGTVRQLDRRPEPDENVADTVKDPAKLARFLLRLFRIVTGLSRVWRPRRVDFEALSLDASGFTVAHRLQHNFDANVRWWVIDWSGSGSEAKVIRSSASTTNTLVLLSNAAGTATIRVEEAG